MSARLTSFWPKVVVPALLIGWLAIALITNALQNSVTADEFAHLPAGLFYWQTGTFHVYRHNPPLLRLLQSAPLAAAGIKAPETGHNQKRWILGRVFQRSLGDRYHQTFFAARMVTALITILTALLLFAVAYRVTGWEGGVVALALFSFNPIVLGHGALVTTDAGFALAFFAVSIVAFQFFRKPSWHMTLTLGTLLGLALLCKFTAQLLFPMLVLAGLVLPLIAPRMPEVATLGWIRLSGRDRIKRLAVVLVAAVLVVDAGYLFQEIGQPIGSFPFSSPFMHLLVTSPLGILPCPLPADFVLGFEEQYREGTGQFVAYLLGDLSRGWRYYYFLALLFKLPLAFPLLCIALAWAIVKRKVPLTLVLAGSLAVPLFALSIFLLFTNVDIGVRYLLFLFPFACLALAHLAQQPLARSQKVLVGSCLSVYAVSSVINLPHHLAYFSEICGGRSRGYLYLADSNLDWGQDLLRLRAYMQENRIPSVSLSHFGLVDPASYGITYTKLGEPNEPDTVVISINHLLGIDPWSKARAAAPYRGRKPKARIGDTLWVFDRIQPKIATLQTP